METAKPTAAKTLRKGVLIVVAGVGLAWGLIATLRQVVGTDAKKARLLNAPIPVETSAAKPASLDEVIGASGVIQQLDTVTMTSRIASRITKAPVDLGSIVHEGDSLMLWDDRVFAAALASAKQSLEMAKAQLDHSVEQLRRMETLYKQGLGSAVDVEQAKIDLATARHNEASATEAVAQAELDLEATSMKAPVTGIVLNRLANPGELTKQNQEVLQLGTLDHVLMVAQVTEEKIGSIALGQTAEVTSDAYPGMRFNGEVVKIDPKTDPTTRAFSAYIKISNPDLKLKPGLSSFARIFRTKQAVVVPNTSLMNAVKDRASVFVVGSNQRATTREITPGISAQGMTEVVAGLKPGEKVVTVGQLNLKENDEVHTVTQQANNK